MLIVMQEMMIGNVGVARLAGLSDTLLSSACDVTGCGRVLRHRSTHFYIITDRHVASVAYFWRV